MKKKKIDNFDNQKIDSEKVHGGKRAIVINKESVDGRKFDKEPFNRGGGSPRPNDDKTREGSIF